MEPEELTVRVAEIDQRSKSNTHRLNKMEERQDHFDQLVSSVAALVNEQEHIKDDVTEIKADVKTLTEKPAKRWDALVGQVILTVAAALVGAMLARLGIG